MFDILKYFRLLGPKKFYKIKNNSNKEDVENDNDI